MTARRLAPASPRLIKPAEDFNAQTERLVNIYLVNAVSALTAQLQLMGDVAWLRQHDPTALANLHRALYESVGRLTEALMAEPIAPPAQIRRA